MARHKLRRGKRGLKTGSSRPVRSAPWKGDLRSAIEGASDQISHNDIEGLLWVEVAAVHAYSSKFEDC